MTAEPGAHVLVDGKSSDSVSVTDRGLQFGDGVFETILVREGAPDYWPEHVARLRRGLEVLGIPFDAHRALERESLRLCRDRKRAVLKIIVTRGAAGRGYAPPARCRPTRMVAVHPAPELPASYRDHGVRVRWCETRIGINPRLAGIKHLNRLEQVMARREWSDPRIAEGLMRDAEGRVVAATACNLFIVRDGKLLTPSLARCGVAGIMRAVIMRNAREIGSNACECELRREDVDSADEVFLTNSLVGVWPVAEIGAVRLAPGPLTRKLMERVLDDR